jgi:hypothetical protein
MIQADQKIQVDDSNKPIAHPALVNALGSTNREFIDGILRELINANWNGPELDERGVNFMLAIISGFEPRDQLETMLAAQMAAVHVASMKFARHLATFEYPQDIAERCFNKLARTFTIQMEALKRYRTSGEKITLQHVSIAEGAQAIVGNVTQAPREKVPGKKVAASARAAFAGTNVVPMPNAEEAEPLSIAEGRRKSAK